MDSVLIEGPDTLVKAIDLAERRGTFTDTDLGLELTVKDGQAYVPLKSIDASEKRVCTIKSTLSVSGFVPADAVETGETGDVVQGYSTIDDDSAAKDGFTGQIAQVLLASGTGACTLTDRRLFGVVTSSNINADKLRSGIDTGRLICFSLTRSMFHEAAVKAGLLNGKVKAAGLYGSFNVELEEPRLHGRDGLTDTEGLRDVSKAELEPLLNDFCSAS